VGASVLADEIEMEIGKRAPASPALNRVAARWARELPDPKLRGTAGACLKNTLETTTFWLEDGDHRRYPGTGVPGLVPVET
jgi:hypothetical protein